MRSTTITSLGLLALQALAAPAPQVPAPAKKASLAEVLMGERIDALIDRTGGKRADIRKMTKTRLSPFSENC